MNLIKFVRGSVWFINLPKNCDGTGVTYGKHPFIILSSNEWNLNSQVVTGVPCTTSCLEGKSLNAKLELPGSSGTAFISQITTVDKAKLYSFCGVLNEEDIEKLEADLTAYLMPNKATLSLRAAIKLPGSICSSNSNSSVEDKPATRTVKWTDEAKSELVAAVDSGDANSIETIRQKYSLRDAKTVKKYAWMFRAEHSAFKK